MRKALFFIWIIFFLGFAYTAKAQSIDSLLYDLNHVENSTERQQILTELGILYQSKNAYNKAISYYQDALQIGNTNTSGYDRNFLLRNMAFCYEEQGAYDKALQLYEEVDRNSTEVNEARIRLWKKIAEISELSGMLDKSILRHQNILDYYTSLSDFAGIAREHNELGYLYHQKGQQALSLTHFKECEKILKRTDIKLADEDRTSIYLNLGVIYTQLSEYSKAEAALTQAYNIRKKKSDAAGTAEACNYLAAYYLVLGNTDLAKKYSDEALRLLGKPGSDPERNQLLLSSYKVKCEVLLQTEDYESYKTYLHQYNQLRDQITAQELKQKKMLLENQFDQERKEYQIRLQLSEKERALERTELEKEKKDRELLLKQREVEELRQEKELADFRFNNQKLQEEKLNQMLQISRQRALTESQEQRITLLEKNKQLQDLTLEKQTRDITVLELEKKNKEIELVAEQNQRQKNFILIILLAVLMLMALIAWFINRRSAKELAIKNMKLETAQHIIEKQNSELKQYNETLETQVKDRTKELSETNVTLAENNEQLQQFAYIISHNLRAPIARIQGLAEVVNHTEAGSREHELVLLNMTASAQELDQIIRDLHKILEIRKGLDNILETVELKEKAELVCQMLDAEIKEANASIELDFEVPSVKAVSSYIESILYNLIGNAIKYRSDNRPVEISVRSQKAENGMELVIADNGLGIELSKHGEKIFGLYKRFHLHREGKGMGLYLVKTQVEAMGGKIRLDSHPDVGTTFYIQLPSRY